MINTIKSLMVHANVVNYWKNYEGEIEALYELCKKHGIIDTTINFQDFFELYKKEKSCSHLQ